MSCAVSERICTEKTTMRDMTDRTAGAPVLNLSGCTDVPSGKMASIVTYLEMTERPPPRPDPTGTDSLGLAPISSGEVERYLSIYRNLGERWMWFSRLTMPRAELEGILGDPGTTAMAMTGPDGDCGLLELDFRQAGECELSFFGVDEPLIGTGAARWMMNRALELAFRPGIGRFWVHTCTFDHPGAVAFYRRSGFTPYKCAVEIEDDPRLNGMMRRDAAPHVPVFEA